MISLSFTSMWDSDTIIKFEIGSGIVKAANSPDNRSWFIRYFGGTPEDDAKLILNGIKYIRQELYQYNISLPAINITDNASLGYNEFICFWGIEKERYSIKTLHELFTFIRDKALNYGKVIPKADIAQNLDMANIMMRDDNEQAAYELYVKSYYSARLTNNFYHCAQILADVSSILASIGQMDLSIRFLTTAIQYCESQNVVDKNLKCRTYYNAASILKQYDYDIARKYFLKCNWIAYNSHNSFFLLLGILGLAEIESSKGNIAQAIRIYGEALKLVDDSNSTTAYAIQREMISLYEQLVEINNTISHPGGELKTYFSDMLWHIISQLGSQLAVNAIFKFFNINQGKSLVSIGERCEIKDNIFNAPTVIGKDNKLILYLQ